MPILNISELNSSNAKCALDNLTQLCWSIVNNKFRGCLLDITEIDNLLSNKKIDDFIYIRHALYELKYLIKISIANNHCDLKEILQELHIDIYNQVNVTSAYILSGIIENHLNNWEIGFYYIQKGNANYNRNNVVTPFFSYSRSVCCNELLLKGDYIIPYEYKYFYELSDKSKPIQVILVSGNLEYIYRFLPNYCSSILKFQKSSLELHVHVCFDTFPYKEELVKINDILKDYNILYEISYAEIPSYWHDKRTFYACSRYLFSNQVLYKYSKGLIITDLDYELTSDVENFFDSIKHCDVASRVNSNIKGMFPWLKVMCGTIYVNNTPSGKYLLECFCKAFSTIFNPLNYNWGLDQNIWGCIYEVSKIKEISYHIKGLFYRPLYN